jgi:nucleoside-diphosphate-sugar epimerase
MKKALITGAAGFVGSQLAKFLREEGFDLALVDNLKFGYLDNLLFEDIGGTEPQGGLANNWRQLNLFSDFHAVDIRSDHIEDLLDGVDTVFHFAGVAPLPVCQSQPKLAYDINVSGTLNLLEACRKKEVSKFIFSSTSAVYENTKSDRLTESDEIQPDLVYAMTKAAAEKACASYANTYGMDISIFRFFNVYGPHQDFKRKSPPFTSYVARELAFDRKPTLYNSSRTAKRDYVHSHDLVRLMKIAGETDKRYNAEIFNVASGVGYSVPDLYSVLLTISNKSIQPEFCDPELYWQSYNTLYQGTYRLPKDRIEKEVYKQAIGDPTKTLKEFGWETTINAKAGLESVYNFIFNEKKITKRNPN